MSAPKIAPIRNTVIDVKRFSTTALTRLPVVVTVRGETFTVLLDPHGQHTLSWRSTILGLLPPGSVNLYKYPLVTARAARKASKEGKDDTESMRRMGLARAVVKFASSPGKPRVAQERASASMSTLEPADDSVRDGRAAAKPAGEPASPTSPTRGRVPFDQSSAMRTPSSRPSRASPSHGVSPSSSRLDSPSISLSRGSLSRGRAAAALRDQLSKRRPAMLSRASEHSLAFFEELGSVAWLQRRPLAPTHVHTPLLVHAL